MWILESRGEFLQGKRVWLKPGQRYLFGRVKKDGVFQAIDHKGVSRRQFVIDVEKVNPGDGSRVHTRSKVVVTDENSRGGTYVDGNLLKGTSHELKDAEHHIRLGIYPHVLTIKWLPVCLSFFLTSKEKKKPDPLGPQRHLLEPLDIKTVLPFLPSQTTHVVAAKRNTVPGLQALISGKYIVDHSYIDALVFAATPEDLEEAENLSPLEKDFDTAWPDPLQHLPPKGREPTAKPSEAYNPNPARENIFDGWTFIFLESGQYETILPAITTGHGKALLFKLESGKTTAEEIIAYMRNAAGEKSFGSFDQSTDSGGVIMIKPTLKEEWTRWGNQLANEVALALGQNYIDQADFLDAILGNDAASLRKVIPFESIDERTEPSAAAAPSITIIAPSSSSLPPVAQVASHPDGTQLVNGSGNTDSPHPTQESPAEPEAPVPKRRRTRAALVSRFKAFDDEFDIDTIAYEPAEESMESQTHPSQHEAATPISAGEELSQLNGQTGRVQKRARSPSDDPMVDQFLPAATAMKKRRLEISQENRSSGLPDVPIPAGVHNNPKTRKRQQKKEIDVRAAARERREAEEEAARRDQENLEANAGELSVEEMKNLAVVVEMEVPLRNGRGTRVDGSADGRWDEKWNGRKNFKKFRRKGEAGGTVRRQAQDVIVPLEEVKRKNFGIGEAYWSSSRDKINDSGHNSHRKSDFASQLQSQTQTQTQSQSQPLAEKSTSPKMTRLQQEAAEIVGAVDVDRPRQTRLADKTQQSQQTMNSRGKRPASSAGSGTAKRQRTIRTRAASETESDEELRFKFGKLSIPVALPAAAASLAYLNARWSLNNDWRILSSLTVAKIRARRLEKNDRVNVFYSLEQHATSPKIAGLPCLVYEGKTWSFKDTYDTVLKYAAWLHHNHGVEPRDVVALDFMNCPDFIFLWLAVWSLGALPAFINYNLTGSPLVRSIRVSTARLLIIDPEIRSVFSPEVEAELTSPSTSPSSNTATGNTSQAVSIVHFSPVIKSSLPYQQPYRAPDSARSKVRGRDPAILISTSGTTGLPKPAIFSWNKIRSGCVFVGLWLGLRPANHRTPDRFYCCMPLYHSSAATVGFCNCLMNGTTFILGHRFSISRFWKEVRDSDATVLQYVGETCRYLLSAPPEPDPSDPAKNLDQANKVRIAFGNGLRPDVWERFKTRFGIETIAEFYGATEGSMGSWNYSSNAFAAGAVARYGPILSLLIGREMCLVAVDYATEMPARDPETGLCIPVPRGHPGELLGALDASDPSDRFAGYFNNAAATEKKVLRSVLVKGDAWFRSGDLMRWDEEGRWWFVDRIGDTFRWKSENVSTAEVGQVLGQHPAVVEANVYGVQIPGHEGRAGCAAILLKDLKDETDKDDVMADLGLFVSNSLPRYSVPLFIRLVNQIQTTGTMKQQKHILRREGVDLDKVEGEYGEEIWWLRQAGAAAGAGRRGDAAVTATPAASTVPADPATSADPAAPDPSPPATPASPGYVKFTRKDWDDLVAGKVRL